MDEEFLGGRTEKKRPLGRKRHRCKNNKLLI